MKLLPLAPKFLQLIYYILSQFLTPFKKVVRGPLSPVGGELVRLGHSLAGIKNWGAQHPLGAEIWSSEKVAKDTISHRDLQGYWTKLHQTDFA